MDANILKGRKNGRYLEFSRDDRTICYDLADQKWKRFLKSGKEKFIAKTGVLHFFRGISHENIYNSFEDPVFSKLIRLVIQQARRRQNSNFYSIFQYFDGYAHLESYFLLNINVNESYFPKKPLSHYNKPVQRFMKESGFIFDKDWEVTYDKYSKLVTDLCQYVLTKYHDNLLIYNHLYSILVKHRITDKFFQLCSDPKSQKQETPLGWWDECHYFGADYKAVMDYVVYCVAVEAMYPHDIIQEYWDYLKMARHIKQIKAIARIKEEQGRTVSLKEIGFPDWDQIEKYPKGLTIRHRIVTRNFDELKKDYDEARFASKVNHDYAWSFGEYCMVTAQSSSDVKYEGNDLNHCVGSYIDSILGGRTQITFLRRKQEPKKSLVTVEIRSNEIQQARGYANRDVNAEEQEWLEKYAKAKNLTFGKHQYNPELPSPTPNSHTQPKIDVAVA